MKQQAAALLAAAAMLTACSPAAPETPETATVIHVIDGDTLIVDTDAGEDRVRLLGVDAPEVAHDGQPAQRCAAEATALITELTTAGTVELHTDPSQPATDKYGRRLAYVEANGTDLSAALIDAGLAKIYHAAPDINRYEHYTQLAATAAPANCS